MRASATERGQNVRATFARQMRANRALFSLTDSGRQAGNPQKTEPFDKKAAGIR